jgi:tripartite-type tricarboxylate transporter receptor subunit TctC
VRLTGIQASHVPYGSGGGALLAALLGGQISWAMDGPDAQLPHVRSRALRALAVSGPRRLPTAPEVPTIAESGLGYAYESWTGLAVAAATPRAIVERLHAQVARIAATPAAREWFAASGAEPGILAPAEMDALVRREHAHFGRVICEAGLRID